MVMRDRFPDLVRALMLALVADLLVKAVCLALGLPPL
jgi:hypothetical protein